MTEPKLCNVTTVEGASPPLCRDCRFCRPAWWQAFFPGGLLMGAKCGHPSALTAADPAPDPVSGRRNKPYRNNASTERGGSWRGDRCGPAGQFWEPAPPWRVQLITALRWAGAPLCWGGYLGLLYLIGHLPVWRLGQ